MQLLGRYLAFHLQRQLLEDCCNISAHLRRSWQIMTTLVIVELSLSRVTEVRQLDTRRPDGVLSTNNMDTGNTEQSIMGQESEIQAETIKYRGQTLGVVHQLASVIPETIANTRLHKGTGKFCHAVGPLLDQLLSLVLNLAGLSGNGHAQLLEEGVFDASVDEND